MIDISLVGLKQLADPPQIEEVRSFAVLDVFRHTVDVAGENYKRASRESTMRIAKAAL
jgi:hypothetical protein